MAQMEARAPEYLSDIAKQNIEKFGAIQTQFLDALIKRIESGLIVSIKQGKWTQTCPRR